MGGGNGILTEEIVSCHRGCDELRRAADGWDWRYADRPVSTTTVDAELLVSLKSQIDHGVKDSLPSKRFHAVLEHRTRNESQRTREKWYEYRAERGELISFLPLLLPPLSFLTLFPFLARPKPKIPFPVFLCSETKGNACYAGYVKDSREWRRIEREGCSFVFVLPPISEHVKEYDQSFFKEFLDMLSQNSGKK